MRHARGKSKSRSLPLALAGTTWLVVLAFACQASAAPAVDEYGANLPTAEGQKTQGSALPQARPDQLPPAVVERLGGSSEAAKLAAVATAEELGAPTGAAEPGASGETDDRSAPGFLAAAGGTLGDPLVLGLIALLALSGIAAWGLTRRGTG